MSAKDEKQTDWQEKLQEQEQRAFRTNDPLSGAQQAGWKYQLDVGKEPHTLERILTIIEIVIAQPRHQWPTNEEWREMLPTWFNVMTRSCSKEEAIAIIESTPRERWHEIPWDFGSWLEAMREREWQWCFYEYEFPNVTIYLALSGWPANLATLEHIFTSAGAQVVLNEKIVR